MSPLALAWRSLVGQPARAVLGIVGITVVGALLLDMLLLSRGLQVSFRDLLESVGFDVRVTATAALPGTGPLVEDASGRVAAIRELPEVDAVVPIRLGRGALEIPGGEAGVALIGAGGPARGTWVVIEGEDLPAVRRQAEPSIVVNSEIAERFGVRPGDRLRLRGRCRQDATALPPVEFLTAGVVDFRFDAPDALTAAMRSDALVRVCGLEDAAAVDFLLVASDPGSGAEEAVAAVARLYPELHVFSNRQLVERLGLSNFSYFRQVSFALSAITLLFAFLLIATLLTVSTNQRLGEVAGLRALGFSRRRVVADLVCESLLLVGVGGLLSWPVGGLLAQYLDAILRGMPGLPERLHFFVFQPRAVALHIALLAVTGLLAALYPVYLVARLPIAATLRKEIVS